MRTDRNVKFTVKWSAMYFQYFMHLNSFASSICRRNIFTLFVVRLTLIYIQAIIFSVFY